MHQSLHYLPYLTEKATSLILYCVELSDTIGWRKREMSVRQKWFHNFMVLSAENVWKTFRIGSSHSFILAFIHTHTSYSFKFDWKESATRPLCGTAELCRVLHICHTVCPRLYSAMSRVTCYYSNSPVCNSMLPFQLEWLCFSIFLLHLGPCEDFLSDL